MVLVGIPGCMDRVVRMVVVVGIHPGEDIDRKKGFDRIGTGYRMGPT